MEADIPPEATTITLWVRTESTYHFSILTLLDAEEETPFPMDTNDRDSFMWTTLSASPMGSHIPISGTPGSLPLTPRVDDSLDPSLLVRISLSTPL